MKKLIFIAFLYFAIVLFYSGSCFAASSGRVLFKKYYCIDCHELGYGGGAVGPDLSRIGKTKSLSWIKAQILHPGSHFILGTKKKINGKIYLVRMPGFKTISSGDLNKLAEYIKTFSQKSIKLNYKKVPAGLKFFREDNCIACHRIDGMGRNVGPDLSHIGRNKSLSWIETQIINPKVHFSYGMPATINGHTYLVIMPALKNIPAAQLKAIAKYLESLK